MPYLLQPRLSIFIQSKSATFPLFTQSLVSRQKFKSTLSLLLFNQLPPPCCPNQDVDRPPLFIPSRSFHSRKQSHLSAPFPFNHHHCLALGRVGGVSIWEAPHTLSCFLDSCTSCWGQMAKNLHNTIKLYLSQISFILSYCLILISLLNNLYLPNETK